jgi:hypothetical protein
MIVTYVIDPFYNTIQAAYQPIVYTVQCTGVPPIVYGDLYINDIYYKTISSTSPIAIAPGGSSSFWLFDLSGLAQEYLQTFMPDITAATIQNVFTTWVYLSGVGSPDGMLKCSVSFRSATVDSYGVITPEGPVPVQATVDSPAVPGVQYYVTNNFYIVNSALNWNSDLSVFQTMLASLKVTSITGTFPAGTTFDNSWNVFPLSKAPNNDQLGIGTCVYQSDYGLFPIITGLISSPTDMQLVAYLYDISGNLIHTSSTGLDLILSSFQINYLPTGWQNLLALDSGLSAYAQTCASYFVALQYHGTSMGVPFTKITFATPRYYLKKTVIHAHMWFRNQFGELDALNFIERDETTKASSSPIETPHSPFQFSTMYMTGHGNLLRTIAAKGRTTVRSFEANTITDTFDESHLEQVKQLLESTFVAIESPNPQNIGSVYPTPTILIPVVVVDSEITTQKWDDRYLYFVTLKYIMSNERIVVRN